MNNNGKLFFNQFFDDSRVLCVDERTLGPDFIIVPKEVNRRKIPYLKHTPYEPITIINEISEGVLFSWYHNSESPPILILYLDIYTFRVLCSVSPYSRAIYRGDFLVKKYTYDQLIRLIEEIILKLRPYKIIGYIEKEVHKIIDAFLDIGFLKYNPKDGKYMFDETILKFTANYFEGDDISHMSGNRFMFLLNLYYQEPDDFKKLKKYFDIATYLIFNGYMETLGHPIFKARFKTRCTLSKLYRLLEKYFEVYGANTMFLQKNFIKLTCMLKDQNNVKIRLLIPIDGFDTDGYNFHLSTIYFSVINYDKEKDVNLSKVKRKFIKILKEIDEGIKIRRVDEIKLPNTYLFTHPIIEEKVFKIGLEIMDKFLKSNDKCVDENTKKILKIVAETLDVDTNLPIIGKPELVKEDLEKFREIVKNLEKQNNKQVPVSIVL